MSRKEQVEMRQDPETEYVFHFASMRRVSALLNVVRHIVRHQERRRLLTSTQRLCFHHKSAAQGQTEKLRWRAQIGSLGPDTQ
jgi:hypothetical protein